MRPVLYSVAGLSSTTTTLRRSGVASASGIRVADRDAHVERRAYSEFAAHADRAAEQFGQALAQRQAEPGSAPALLDRRIDLREILEQGAMVLGRDADAGVGDR